jgi:hypothetical protein
VPLLEDDLDVAGGGRKLAKDSQVTEGRGWRIVVACLRRPGPEEAGVGLDEPREGLPEMVTRRTGERRR